MNCEEISELINHVAHEVQQALDAEAVVVMSLVRDGDGEFCFPIGSTGSPDAMRIVAAQLQDVADAMRRAADSNVKYRETFPRHAPNNQ